MGPFAAAIQRFGIGRLATLIGVAAGVAAVMAALVLRVGQEPDALLYSNLDLREAAEISQALDQAGIKYRARGDGSTIMVSRNQVGTARMMLAQRGLVTSGSVGYEIFDNQSALGQTEFQQNINEKRALEGELARTVMDLRGVTSARVHITMPRREMFRASGSEPSAAVVVGLGGRDLNADQVRAVRNLIASSVPGLRPERVTVLDQTNRTLAAGSEESGGGSALANDRRAEVEARMTERIRQLVEGVVGPGAARVEVTADIDLSRQTVQQQVFDPDGQVVRSTQASEATSEDSEARPDGGVTALNNIPGGDQAGQTAFGSRSGTTGETTNYEISNTTTTTVREPGEVRRLSVAVAVDGITTPAAGGGEAAYAPRPDEDMQRIEQLVRSAMGYNEQRGDQLSVINVRFNRDTASFEGTEAGGGLLDLTKNDIMRIIEIAVLAITALLLIFFVLRPMLKAANTGGGGAVAVAQLPGGSGAVALADGSGAAALLPAGAGGQAALPAPSEMEQRIDIARIEGQVKASSVRKVADFVQANPDESAAILRNWVHEG